MIIARNRKFTDGIEAIWFLREGLPKGSHKLLLDVIHDNTETLIRYAKLKNKILGLTDLNYQVLQISIPPTNKKYNVAEARDIAVNALLPIGKKFQQNLKVKLDNHSWMHLAPMPNKNFTFAVWPPVGGAPSFFIQTFNGTYANVRGFTSAMIFMMDDPNTSKDKKPDTRDDPAIHGNSVIYAGRMLFEDYIQQQFQTKQERVLCLLSSLDVLWRQYIYYAVHVELDEKVQDMIMHGQTPNGKKISQTYLELLRQYYGHNEGGIFVDDLYASEWITENVKFSTYENQFWPPAYAAATMIFEKLKAGDEKIKTTIHGAWGNTETNLSHDLLLTGGIDMTTKLPYETAFKKMNSIIDEIETLME